MPENVTTTQAVGQTVVATALTTGEAEATPATFEAWFETAPDPIKGLVTSHEEGLRNTLQALRLEREEYTKQLKSLMKDAESTPALRQQVEQMIAEKEGAERRASFYEDAARPEIGCTNAKLAYLAAVESGLIDSRGRVSWDAMKTQYAELFRQAIPRGNAGTGIGTTPPPAGGMNAYIRRAAGRE